MTRSDLAGGAAVGPAALIVALAVAVPAMAVAVSPFTDIAPRALYEGPADWAFDNGITTGKTPTVFDSGGEVVTFLKRYNDNIIALGV